MVIDIIKTALNVGRRGWNRVKYALNDHPEDLTGIQQRKNILFIVADCLRRDRIEIGSRETAPFVTNFDSKFQCVAAAPWTYSSVPSIITGLYPHNHGARYESDETRNQDISNPPNGLRDDVFTLPELLSAAGYETNMLTGIGMADLPMTGRFKTSYRMHNATAVELLNRMKSWWNETDAPKLGYVQLGDLHEPMEAPDERPFGEIPDVDGIERWRFREEISPKSAFKEYRDARFKLYDTLVRYIDTAVAEFLADIDERENTIVVFTADHGEEFWDHREMENAEFEDPRGIWGVGHGHALVPAVLDIPVYIDGLDIDFEDRISSVDLVPTILTALGIHYERAEFDGVALQQRDMRPPIIAEEVAYGPNQVSVTDGNHHLIHIPAREKRLLMDFQTGAVIDDASVEGDLVKYLPEEKQIGEQIDITEGTEEQLKELGYL